MPRALIAGCGYVGIVAADLFHLGGWEVEGWTRSEESAAALAKKKSFTIRGVDISDREQVQAAMKSAATDRQSGERFDVVIHCASTRGGSAEAYRMLYANGVQHLIDVLHPRRFVFTSSTSVYAQTSGEWVNEESAADPLHERGRILREAEELVRQAGGLIARLAGIYGPERSALLRKFLSGEARIEPGKLVNQIHRDDAAAALFLLGTLPDHILRSGSPIYNVADNEPLAQRDCYEWLATKLGRPAPEIAETPRARKRGASNKQVSNQKLRSLGWSPRYSNFRVGMEQSVLPALSSKGC